MRAQQQTVPIAALRHGAPHAVLIVHHDQQRVDALALGLADDGHRALTATTLVEARSQLASVHIDLVVVELLLGREQGLDLVAQIGPPCGKSSDVPVVVLSGKADPSAIVDAFSLGAVDCLPSPFELIELRARVASALRWMSVARACRSGTIVRPVVVDARDQLTVAEGAVADRAARAMTNRLIAAELFISVKAVEFHLTNVFRKLELSSRTQLAVLFANAGRGASVMHWQTQSGGHGLAAATPRN